MAYPISAEHWQTGTPSSSRIISILLVEDCKSDVFLVERMLEDTGVNCFYDLMDVPRLIDAFSRLEHNLFDLIMLDLNLKDIDGIASVAALHAQAPGVPILVYSGMDDPRIREKALMCGATHYLVKGRESGRALRNIIARILTPAA